MLPYLIVGLYMNSNYHRLQELYRHIKIYH
jgi:hypothetical protein